MCHSFHGQVVCLMLHRPSGSCPLVLFAILLGPCEFFVAVVVFIYFLSQPTRLLVRQVFINIACALRTCRCLHPCARLHARTPRIEDNHAIPTTCYPIVIGVNLSTASRVLMHLYSRGVHGPLRLSCSSLRLGSHPWLDLPQSVGLFSLGIPRLSTIPWCPSRWKRSPSTKIPKRAKRWCSEAVAVASRRISEATDGG